MSATQTALSAIIADFEHLKHNYSEAAASYRHFSGLRFVIMSVYVAIVGALGGVALGVVGNGVPGTGLVRTASAAALLATVSFFICEIACDRSRRHFIEVMRELEVKLGYTTMIRFPMRAPFKASYAFRLLYAVNLLYWFWILIANCLCNHP
jgi:hypothetical protein